METITTKNTLGLLTIEPTDPLKDKDIEVKSEEVLAIENAARDAIAAKKKAKKLSRQKSKESQSPSRRRVGRKKSKDPAPAPDLEAKKKAEEEAARKTAEEAAARKAAEEEAARKKAEEEAARLAAEEQESLEEPEPSMTGEIGEEEPLPPLPPPQPKKERPKPTRSISFFPFTGDNVGLKAALERHSHDVPFDWEKPEWTKEHVDLRHTSTMSNTYGWEMPDWAKNSNLKKTEMGEKAKQGVSLSRTIRFGGYNKKSAPRRTSSLAERGIINLTSKDIVSELPEWARENLLKSTEYGEAARQGLNLAIPYNVLKSMAAGNPEGDSLENSFASLNGSKLLNIEKPDWAVNPSLKPSDKGLAVRQGANLALPVVGIREIALGEESARQGDVSPNSSFVNHTNSQKNIGWEKPAWTKAVLKKTSKGDELKEKGTLFGITCTQGSR